ncbi:DNA alkylation repair protein [Chitinophaga sp. SYP-B3965]|uniref:DNA alkylation repair protein n=1 Tax=Chitinophaga sp. SYP-B3965 TaxID=2663120 RepID=UPI001299D085|nr:DNA alkylation repair protein [Chitinophaga sp. SYP-B3965]MRG43712.1 DNA alkylation repair protein [Chitinophaga sp. SYP-B3965]
MTLQEVLDAIKTYGSVSTKNTMMRHGCQEPIYGAKVGDLKLIQKKIKNDQALALSLYDSGVYEAMYLAGLVADGSMMTEKQLEQWVQHAKSPAISEYTVAWVAAEHPQGWKLALKWIDSSDEMIACSGWNTLSGIVSMRPDAELDIPKLQQLLKRVQAEIHTAQNRVRYSMNGFVIGVGTYVDVLTKEAMAVAKKVGVVSVNMGDTACKVPLAEDYINAARNRPGGVKKKKTTKC